MLEFLVFFVRYIIEVPLIFVLVVLAFGALVWLFSLLPERWFIQPPPPVTKFVDLERLLRPLDSDSRR
jgi:hypothetical protein